MKEINGKLVPSEDNGSEIDKEMTVESVKEACLSARKAKIKRFDLDEKDSEKTS